MQGFNLLYTLLGTGVQCSDRGFNLRDLVSISDLGYFPAIKSKKVPFVSEIEDMLLKISEIKA